jgi:hypothetical protein
MRRIQVVTFLVSLLLCACSNAPVVTGDSRGFFDTAKGMYGGNEFDARSTEGAITVANEPQPVAPAAPAKANAPATAQANATAPVAPRAAAPAAAPGIGRTPIAIDANAFAAVFGPAASGVKPTAEQLMQLDSLSLVAGDATRVDLQKAILACRRAGEACRIAHP